MGFNIVANAFKSKVKALEEDLKMANEERTELEEKVNESREFHSRYESGSRACKVP